MRPGEDRAIQRALVARVVNDTKVLLRRRPIRRDVKFLLAEEVGRLVNAARAYKYTGKVRP